MEAILEVNRLNTSYQTFSLNDIHFTLPKGMILGLIGENGAGKTTIIRSVLNMIPKSDGEIKIFGLDMHEHEAQIKQDIAVVMDTSFLSDYLTPNDIHKIMKHMYPKWDPALFFQYLETFHLPKDQMSKELSSGMKMKLRIVTALSSHPKLLILDEPTSGLDPVARNDILDLFQDFIQDEEHSILLTTHITSDLDRIADYIIFVNDGSIILSKSRDELLEEYGIAKCTEAEFRRMDRQDYVKYIKTKYEYQVLVNHRSSIQKKYNISVIDRPTIEEIMLIYIKGVM